MVSDGQVPSPNAASQVAAQIRKQIVLGELAEGDLLPSEAEMIKRFGVSRPTLRQAFRILETEHLITVQRGSRGGTTVHRPSTHLATRYLSDLLRHRKTSLGDVLTARLMIEPAAVAQLARHHEDEAVKVLQALVDEQRTGEADAAANAADQFHVRLVELAGNPLLAQYCKLLHSLIRGHARRLASTRRSGDVRRTHDSADAHAKLVDLVSAGAVHAALEHWRDHLSDIRAQLAAQQDLDTALEPAE
jgi:GntR family transcriptional repressor for pyruvate dehydrogenase complex